MEFNLVKDAVMVVLKTNPEARDSDWVCISEVMNFYVDVEKYTFGAICEKGKEGTIPTFETIRRWRQKFQEMYPELRGTERVRKFRKELEEEVKISLKGVTA